MPGTSWLQRSFRAATAPSGRHETLCHTCLVVGLAETSSPITINRRKDSISARIDRHAKGAVITSR